jgi:hypothetical protein
VTPPASVDPSGVDPQGGSIHDLHGSPEPGEAPMLGLQHSRGAGSARGGSLPGNMTLHGGAIMTDSVVKTIFWGPKWSDPTFAGDKITGLNRLYAGLASATAYVASNTEYKGADGKLVGTSVAFAGSVTDLAPSPRSAPKTSAVLAEVCKMITSPVANGYYPVYTDVKRGSAGYCAWHSYGTCAGVPVQFGFFFALDGDAGCDPTDPAHDPPTTHSQGLSALASVSGHEWSETVTDPRNGGYWDSAGNENSDKCAWSYPPTQQLLVDPATGIAESWKIQGNWSNAAFTSGTGYKNRDGQAGCLPNNLLANPCEEGARTSARAGARLDPWGPGRYALAHAKSSSSRSGDRRRHDDVHVRRVGRRPRAGGRLGRGLTLRVHRDRRRQTARAAAAEGARHERPVGAVRQAVRLTARAEDEASLAPGGSVGEHRAVGTAGLAAGATRRLGPLELALNVLRARAEARPGSCEPRHPHPAASDGTCCRAARQA